MRYGSVCSGIEAATAAWHHMGWEPAFFSEIEAFPRAVLEHHYPEVPLHGDFTTIERNQYGQIDLLVGGTPCQSFSVAGLRGGLDDERGNLALEFCRLAQRERPRWIVWENVPGVLSSNGGRDFGSILGALEDLGYGLAYRVLDAQYFGVAQRRRRVFVVGYFGDWRPAAAVLFERHSMSGHPAPSREARKETARAALSGAEERCGRGGDGSAVKWPADVACTLDTDFASKWGQNNQHVNAGCPLFVPDTANAITASLANSATRHNKDENVIAFDAYNQAETEGVFKTVAARNDQDTASCVAYPINTQLGLRGPDTSNTTREGLGVGGADDPSYTLQAGHSHGVAYSVRTANTSSNGWGVQEQVTHTLDQTTGPAVAYSIMPMNSGKDYKARETEVAQPIMAAGPVGGNQGGDYIVTPFDTTQITSPHNYSSPKAGDPCHPLAAGAHSPAIAIGFDAYNNEVTGDVSKTIDTGQDYHHVPNVFAFSSNMSAYDVQSDGTTPTLKLGGHDGGNPPAVATGVFYGGQGAKAGSIAYSNEVSPTLKAGNSGTNRSPSAHIGSAVRRLTPVECERLQGFPDNFTAIPWRKKEAADCPDGPRYKALGNSMAVPVMRWIGERISMIDNLISVL